MFTRTMHPTSPKETSVGQPGTATSRLWRNSCALLASVAAFTVLVLLPTSAQADTTIDLGPMTIGGSYTAQSFYNPPVVVANTTCVGVSNRVVTQLVLKPDSRTAGQHFHVKFWARDLTGGVGQWALMRTDQRYVAMTDAMMYQPVTAMAFDFQGREGHTYQLAAQSWVANPGSSWQFLGEKYTNHYTTFGAGSATVYGAAIQGMVGAPRDRCQIV